MNHHLMKHISYYAQCSHCDNKSSIRVLRPGGAVVSMLGGLLVEE